MAKSDANALRQNSTTARGMSQIYGQNAATQNSILTPTLSRLAAGGGGYTPGQINNMNTSALQTVGGANADASGRAASAAARTNNVGADNAFRLAAAHDATGELSDAALGVQNASARLAAQQQDQALGELGNLYSTNVGAGENALGLSTSATNAANNAANSGFWRGVFGNALNPANYSGFKWAGGGNG